MMKPLIGRKICQPAKCIAKIIAVGLTAVLISSSYAAQPQKGGIKKTEAKEIAGEIVSLSPWKNPVYIGLACGAGENVFDVYFNIDKNVRIEHKRSLDEIKLGDTVSILFEETTELKGAEEQIKRVAKKISFIRRPAGTGERPDPRDAVKEMLKQKPSSLISKEKNN